MLLYECHALPSHRVILLASVIVACLAFVPGNLVLEAHSIVALGAQYQVDALGLYVVDAATGTLDSRRVSQQPPLAGSCRIGTVATGGHTLRHQRKSASEDSRLRKRARSNLNANVGVNTSTRSGC